MSILSRIFSILWLCVAAIMTMLASISNLIFPRNIPTKHEHQTPPTTFMIPQEAKVAIQKLEKNSPGLVADLEAHFAQRTATVNEYIEQMKKIGEVDDTEMHLLQYNWQRIMDSSQHGIDVFCEALRIYLKFIYISENYDNEKMAVPGYESKNLLFSNINTRISKHIENIKRTQQECTFKVLT